MAVLLVNVSSQAWGGDDNQSAISKVLFSISKQTPSSKTEMRKVFSFQLARGLCGSSYFHSRHRGE